MADYFRSQAWKKLTERDVPELAAALGSIAKFLQESNKREERKFQIEEKILLTKLKTEKHKLNEQAKATANDKGRI